MVKKNILATLITLSIWAFAIFGVIQLGLWVADISAWRPEANDSFRITSAKDPNSPLLTVMPDGRVIMDMPKMLKAWKAQIKEAKKKSVPSIPAK